MRLPIVVLTLLASLAATARAQTTLDAYRALMAVVANTVANLPSGIPR